MSKERILDDYAFLVSQTNEKGIITFASDDFCEIAGYSVEELIGKPHNIVRHPCMPKTIFKELWQDLRTKGSWSGIVKNLRKDEGFYWVYAEVSGVYKDGTLVEYKSIRTPISFDDKVKYQLLYDQIKKDTNETTRRVIYS